MKILQHEGHSVAVYRDRGMVGYAPLDLLAEGKISEAAVIAQKLFNKKFGC